MDLLREKRRALGHHRAHGGGKSEQSQSQQYTDNRAVLGQDSILARDGSTVNTSTTNVTQNYALDNGAINRAFDTTDTAMGTVSDALGKVLAFAGSSQDSAIGAIGTALQLVNTDVGRVLDQTASTQQLVANAYDDAKGQGAQTQKILIVAVAGALLVAALSVRKA